MESWINEDLEKQREIERELGRYRIRELPDFGKGITFHNLHQKATFYDLKGRKTGGSSRFDRIMSPPAYVYGDRSISSPVGARIVEDHT